MRDNKQEGSVISPTSFFSAILGMEKTWLGKSENFKQMKLNSLSGENATRKIELVRALQKADSFVAMLQLIDDFTPGLDREPWITKLCVKALTFFGSYVDEDAAFHYYTWEFKKEVIIQSLNYDVSVRQSV